MPATQELPADLFAALPAGQQDLVPLLRPLVQQTLDKLYNVRVTDLPAYQAVRQLAPPDQARAALALAAARQVCLQHRSLDRAYDYRIGWAIGDLQTALLRSALPLTEADVLQLFADNGLNFNYSESEKHLNFWGYPAGLLLTQLERLAKKAPLAEATRAFLTRLIDLAAQVRDGAKLRVKAQEILNLASTAPGEAAPLPTLRFDMGDPFGLALHAFAVGLDPGAPTTRPWLDLLRLWAGASGGTQPTAKGRKALGAATAAVGAEAVRRQGSGWLALLGKMPVVDTEHRYESGDHAHIYTTHEYLMEANQLLARGLIWTLQPLVDAALLRQLAAYAARCYRKVPGRGPLAAGLGNACLLALAQSGLPGVAALAQVRPQVKQTNTQALIAKYMADASAKLGVSPAEIEDMAVPTFGLDAAGHARHELGEYAATLSLAEGKAELHWTKAGKPLKAAPAALKSTHAAELKELKATQLQLQQTYTAQRERLDRSFIEERYLAWPWFEQYYLAPGLLRELAQPLIWRLHRADGSWQDAVLRANQWQSALEQPVLPPTADTFLQLWHPVLVPAAEALAWRKLLESQQLRQPLKQAFREVYLLTPPEERTRTYSNRMAAHILKQHQFSTLAKMRGWRYSLMGAYDKGYESDQASLALPGGLRAEYWVSEVNADGAWNDTGIWNYVSTDQLRFVRGEAPVPLPEISPLVFSEVMRDVDLFVGVASVGNDPLWRDNGGLAQYRNYWESYSFGELSEVAKTRRLALERLVPRLKIGKVSHLTDRFLVVKGHLHTYKIHLGSGNILMEPNDQYLCIVPDRSTKAVGAPEVFLPFEGDTVLSIILSKALLLMDDDKITDETIIRQLK
ncbi:DUF4132 domain-containing protein [Hymenobacter psoromatis]|uniref:DUF4132 domain-containing protein n=1 Tax=Hymenobacter psoromatis TaxID=1484116 RepID=UPI001CBF6A51|nr:DUF4132 domain-containing protein [Hymenobacter psoromatis]